ncbi:MAG: biopolymer transporter ExbD [Planctomycetes bacterium]|nr:biopolymer transporter ExbD [Planctomycetota bacterium]
MSNQALDAAQEEAKPDMTPMIDCVFLMIIFFICIDFKVLEAKLPAYLPKDKGSQSFQVDPIEQLAVKIQADAEGSRHYESSEGGPGLINKDTGRPYRYRREGHKFHWEVGPKPIYKMDELLAELKRIATDPSLRQPDKDKPGQTKIMPVVIEPYPGTFYDDAAKTADACKEAGFVEINFGGGLGAAPKK